MLILWLFKVNDIMSSENHLAKIIKSVDAWLVIMSKVRVLPISENYTWDILLSIQLQNLYIYLHDQYARTEMNPNVNHVLLYYLTIDLTFLFYFKGSTICLDFYNFRIKYYILLTDNMNLITFFWDVRHQIHIR